jgi:hypothetical protein
LSQAILQLKVALHTSIQPGMAFFVNPLAQKMSKVLTLEKNKLKPWLVEQWCIGQITGSYLWHMEDVLDQYALP